MSSEIAKQNMVITQRRSMGDNSTCSIKSCNKHDIYSIFVGEYPRLSNYMFGSCKDHLATLTNRAIKESHQSIRKQKAAETREYRKKAKELLGIK